MVPLFPESRRLEGPLTAASQRRTLRCLLALWGCGLLIIVPSHAAPWTAFGLGLFMPGAGLLYSGHFLLFLLALLLFVAALALWLMMGMFIAPIGVWLGFAIVGAAWMSAESSAWTLVAIPAACVLALTGSHVYRQRRLPEQLTQAQSLNAHLARVSAAPLISRFAVAEPLSDDDIGSLRFTLDLALQPIDQWRGFTTIDQFREAAWRYQLYAMSWSLGLLRSTRLPAFSGYLEQAQRNAIVKMTDRRVWSYWFLENLWGNLRINADPMLHENIMLSGWYATALGIYAITTGDRCFDEPGSLPFRWSDRKTFSYDHPAIVQAITRNFDQHELCLFPCEPNWVFMYCNEQAMAGVTLFDRSHATQHASDRLPRFRNMLLDEFTLADGSSAVIYSNRTGFHLSGKSLIPYATSTAIRNVFAPDLAARSWEQMRHQFMRRDGSDLLNASKLDQLDPGNYQFNGGAFLLASLMQSAREMGDNEIYDFARDRFDALGGTRRNGIQGASASTYSHLVANSGRFGSTSAWHRLGNTEYPSAWRNGPCLCAAPYPDVLVASAQTDGQALDLVLVPGSSKGGCHELRFSRLMPNSRYRVSGVDETFFVSDAEGRSSVSIRLEGRRDVRIAPSFH